MEILQLIEHKLEKLGITFDEVDAQITLNEVDQSIKNYCHIDCIPAELIYVRTNMAVDYIRYQEANKPNGDGENGLVTSTKVGPITSIKSGEVSYQFANSADKSNVANGHIADLDTIVHNYQYQLNNFRRLP